MRPTRVLAVTALAAVLTLSACSSGGDDDGGGGGDRNAAGSAAEPARPQGESLDSAERGFADETVAKQVRDDVPAEQTQPTEQAVIRKGNVQLRSDDVEEDAFAVQAVVDKYGGEITDTQTGSDDEGEVRLARMVVRVPEQEFQEAFADLEGVGERISSTSTSEDVTSQIIDTSVRIRAQERSLSRVEVLLDRAFSIRDIVAIESQLTRRQADLDSLKRRYAFLRGQTTMSTITVNIERAPEEKTEQEKKDDDDSGFLSGLDDGWDALTAFGGGLATVAGALLPWMIVLLLLGGPVGLLVRRVRRRAFTPGPATEPTDA